MEDRQLVPLWSLLPCCPTAWDALVYSKKNYEQLDNVYLGYMHGDQCQYPAFHTCHACMLGAPLITSSFICKQSEGLIANVRACMCICLADVTSRQDTIITCALQIITLHDIIVLTCFTLPAYHNSCCHFIYTTFPYT
jgi:hypothetical protein